VDTIDLDDLQDLAEKAAPAAGLALGLSVATALFIPITIGSVIVWGITRLLK
jgi:hypothetical protein